MVLYGIKVNNSYISLWSEFLFFLFYGKGEGNGASSTDNRYACSFSKMIQYWREIWNQRTNGITDIQFPFGFVQVCFTKNH